MTEAHRISDQQTPSANWTDRVPRRLAVEHHLVGASLLRIGLGCIVLYHLVRHWAERDFLWGPHGVYPLWLFERELPSWRAPSFLAVESELLFQTLYLGGIGVALLYVVGWQSRLLGIWLYVVVWSLFQRNPMLLTGGERIVLAMLPPVLLLMNTSAYLSADSGWRRIGDDRRPPLRPFSALFHNVGVLYVLIQLSIVYGISGITKLLGETWRDGTAVYYAMRSAEFTLPGWSELIYLNPILVPLLTYGTILFELGFPVLIWSERTRWIASALAVVFHLFIAIFLGLTLFSAQALVFQLVLFSDERYRGLLRRVRFLIAAPGRWGTRRSTGPAPPEVGCG